jgi:hypothetical protein
MTSFTIAPRRIDSVAGALSASSSLPSSVQGAKTGVGLGLVAVQTRGVRSAFPYPRVQPHSCFTGPSRSVPRHGYVET